MSARNLRSGSQSLHPRPPSIKYDKVVPMRSPVPKINNRRRIVMPQKYGLRTFGGMIATENLTFRYHADAPVLTFPNVACAAGERLLLLGESGCGKTTLLHLMSGLLQPASGQVVVAGTELGGLSGRDLDRFRGAHIGLVFQRPHFVQGLTVLQNLALPGFLSGKGSEGGEDRARAMLARLGISGKADRRPRDLSIGEQQRAGIARALIHSPEVLLADEPTSALDDRSTERVIALLESEADRVGAALVVVTHDTRLKDRYAHRVTLNPVTAGA